jgi:hypothetical protein
LGETKAPLAYVIHDEATVPGEADNPRANYAMPGDKIIRWMSHMDAAGEDFPTFQDNKSKAWQVLSEVCRDKKKWTYVKALPAQL